MGTDELGRILVVDDDADIRDVLREYLSDEGFTVSTAGDGPGMRSCLQESPVDLVILDLKLPGEDGFTLARDLRRGSNIGIIILTGKDDVIDRVAGLEIGADDYITKPFHFREMLARVRSVMRRRNEAVSGQSDSAETPPSSARFAGWELDVDARTLRSPAGEDVDLTAGEFDLLVSFLDHPNRTLSRDQLLDYARGRDATPFDRSIDVQVGRLRQKLEADPKRPALIKTVRGAGYMLAADVERR